MRRPAPPTRSARPRPARPRRSRRRSIYYRRSRGLRSRLSARTADRHWGICGLRLPRHTLLQLAAPMARRAPHVGCQCIAATRTPAALLLWSWSADRYPHASRHLHWSWTMSWTATRRHSDLRSVAWAVTFARLPAPNSRIVRSLITNLLAASIYPLISRLWTRTSSNKAQSRHCDAISADQSVVIVE
jgi:hypothetical protein